MHDCSKTSLWRELQQHQHHIAEYSLTDWFSENPQRFAQFSLVAENILLDYSKNCLNAETMDLLLCLAHACQLPEKIEALLSGEVINYSENRPALHTALRNLAGIPIYVKGEDVMPGVQQAWTSMNHMATEIRAGRYQGFSNQPVDTIVHFGIGGSDLGPLMVFTALEAYVDTNLHYHFFSHVDPAHVQRVLSRLNPATTLVIVASKSFTTPETLANAAIARAWLLTAAPTPAAAAAQFIAVTAESHRAVDFGVDPKYILPVWEWVGGRFSVWSAMSLIVAIAIGPQHFRDFLAGAEAIDRHFRNSELSVNMPVILGLLDVWYNNFFGKGSRALIPYGRLLRYFPEHMQQVFMESLGKQVDQAGEVLDTATGFAVWGGTGTNSQHSFHQLLLQTNRWVPIEFILPADDPTLVANCLAQSQLLMTGYPAPQESYRSIPGGYPSQTLILPKITPYILGALLAIYEHRVFVNSVIWNINAFDQWGVERGKTIAQQIMGAMLSGTGADTFDSSTAGLLNWIKQYEKTND